MSARSPRFEVVHTGPWQFHARFIAPNGEIVWTTETYRKRQTALDACWILQNSLSAWQHIEIRGLDERTAR